MSALHSDGAAVLIVVGIVANTKTENTRRWALAGFGEGENEKEKLALALA